MYEFAQHNVARRRCFRVAGGLGWLVALFLAWHPCRVFGTQWYVSTNGTGGAGTNWVTAFTNVQRALNAAVALDEVVIAGHTFQSSATLSWTSRTSHVTVRGGYAATNLAAQPGTRDPGVWPTVFRKTATGRVLWMRGVTNGTLDGVTLTGGDATVDGGGLYAESSTGMVLKTCTFTGNRTTAHGGAFALYASWCTGSNCIFRANTANNFGGAGYVYNNAGLYVIDSVVRDNGAAAYGSALMNYGVLRLRNCLVVNNGANGEAALSLYGGMVQLTGCIIAHNGRAGIYNNGAALTLTNCIAWDNVDDLAGTPPARLVACDVEDGNGQGINGCISVPPLFQSGYYLATNSPCVNAGTNNAADWGVAGLTTRADGIADGGRVDIGYHHSVAFASAWAHVYVATNGHDTLNNGTNPASPFRTIGRALAAARDGTQVHVGAGRYTNGLETFPLRLSNRWAVRVLGAGRLATLIHAAGANQSVLVVSNSAQAVFSGLTLSGGNRTGSGGCGGGVYSFRGGGLLLADCTVASNRTSYAGGGICTIYGSCWLSNVLVSANYSSERGGGIYVDEGGEITADHSILTANTVSTYGRAVMNYGPVTLRNTLIHNNGGGGDAAFCQYAGTTLKLLNCTVANNPPVGFYRVSGTMILTNCIVWGNGNDFDGPVTLSYCDVEDGDNEGVNGCIRAEPLFRTGYYLATNSPCVNAGTNTAAAWGLAGRTTRADGIADSGRVDMGYHQWSGQPPAYAHIYVATTGHDTVNNGTNPASPFRTVGKALATARDGSRIHIGAGQFTNGLESFPLRMEGRCGVEMIGTGRTATVINAAGSSRGVLVISNAAQTILRGITLARGNASGHGGGIYAIRGGGLSIADCAVSSNQSAANAGGISLWGTACRVSNCVITANYGSWGGGIYVNADSALTCEDSLMTVNNAGGYGRICMNYGPTLFHNVLMQGNGGEGEAAFSNYGNQLVIRNCTLVNNGPVGISRGGGAVTVLNSILWDNGDEVAGSGISLQYSDIEDGDTGPGCISANPAFDMEFYLATNSPCVDSGTNTAAAWGLGGRTTWRVGGTDTGRVNMGYHYAGGLSVTYPDLYVATNGVDTGNMGTNPAAPLRTVGKATSLAQSGTRIHVAAGRYDVTKESFPILLSGKSDVQVLGAGWETTQIDASGSGKRVWSVANAAHAVFGGLTISGGAALDDGGGMHISGSGGVLLQSCSVSSNQAVSKGGGLYLKAATCVASGCVFTVNAGSWGGAFHVASDASLLCRESVVDRNTASSYGRVCMNYGPAVFRNALIKDNTGSGEAAFSQYGSGLQLESCTVLSNGTVGIQRNAGTVSVANSILWANGDDVMGAVTLRYSDIEDGDSPGVNGCLSVDPGFADTTYCHLKARAGYYQGGFFSGGTWVHSSVTSPLLDMGDPTADYSREPFSHGDRINIGYDGNTPVASRSTLAGTWLIVR